MKRGGVAGTLAQSLIARSLVARSLLARSPLAQSLIAQSLIALSLLDAHAAHAQDAGARPASPLVVTVAPSSERSTVDALAGALAAQVTRALGETPTLRGELRVELCSALGSAPRGPALVAALTGPALAALRADARFAAIEQVDIAPSDAAEESDVPARAAARGGYDALLRIVLETRGNYLIARAAVWQTSRGGWRALFRAAPVRLASPFVRARLDAELRQYVGALPQVSADTVVARALALPSRGYVALSAADLDGDGRSELVLARAESVEVLRLGASVRGAPRLEPVASASFSTSLARASSRPRRVIGTAARVGDGVVLRTSELAAPVRAVLIDGALSLRDAATPCGGDLYPLDDACASAVPGHDHFAARLVSLSGATSVSGTTSPSAATALSGATSLTGATSRDAAQRRAGPLTLAGFYARAARKLRRGDGSVLDVEAVITPAGRLAVRVDQRPGGAVSYGTALALADLDDDGLAELLASGPGLAGERDHLALLRVRATAQLLAVWESEPLAGDVWIAASADLDDDGLEELLAVEEPAPGASEPARLWIVR